MTQGWSWNLHSWAPDPCLSQLRRSTYPPQTAVQPRVNPVLRYQDVPVGASWKPVLEKVPEMSSSQISNHFLSWVQDLGGSSGGQAIGQNCGVRGPLNTPLPLQLTCPRAGGPCLFPGNVPPRHLRPPITAAAQWRPPLGLQPMPSSQRPPHSVGLRPSTCLWKSSWRERESHRTQTGHTLVGGATQAEVCHPRASRQDLGEFGLYRAGSPEGTVGCGGSHL